MIRILIATLLITISVRISAQQLEVITEASLQQLCASESSTLSAYPATEEFGSTPLPQPGNRPVVTITFTEPVTADEFTIEKAGLKYDKDFGYSIQVDDGLIDIMNYAFPLFEGGNVDGETFPGLFYTDGCGNDIPFKMATAHFSWHEGMNVDMHDPEGNFTELFINWDQIIELYQNDWGIYNHAFHQGGASGNGYYDIMRNHSFTKRNTHPSIPGGIDMNLFVIPSASTDLGPLAIENGYNQVISLNYSYGDPYYNINTDTYYNVEISRHFNISSISSTIDELADAADEEIKGMSTTGLHEINFDEFRQDLEYVENTYGKSGSDQLWFATSEEVIQYLYVRDHVDLATQISGNTVTIELTGELPDDLRFYALSLLVESDKEITQIDIDHGFNHSDTTDYNEKTLINLNWNESVIPSPRSLAGEFTTEAENSEDAYDALIAMDYTMMIEDTVTQNYFLSRLCAIPGGELPDGLCSDLPEYSFQWLANGEVFSNEPVTEVTPDETTTYSIVMTTGGEELTGEITVEVTDPPTVEVAEGETVCPNQSLTLSATAENYSAFNWQSSGDGTFSSPETPVTEYVPGDADIAGGEVTLYATAQSEGCDDATDQVTYQFYPAPSISAPADTSMCHEASLSISISAENYNTISWSADGDGTFSSVNGLSTSYTPGSQDIETGQVTLTATAFEENCGSQAAADIAVEIVSSPQGNAGELISVCQGQGTITLQGTGTNYSDAYWQTNGSGTFVINGIEAEYEPVESDFSMENLAFELILEPEVPCSGNFTETVPVAFINPPEADAGEDSLACYGMPYQVQGNISNASDFYWSTSGNGSFTDENSLNTYYQFGTVFQQTGQVTLTLHALPQGNCELEATDGIILTQAPLPEINAGDDGEMCYADTAYQLQGNVTGTDDFYWITQGDGTFNDTTVENPLYYPGSQEKAQGAAYPGLRLSGDGLCYNTVSDDFMLLSIVAPPVAGAGQDLALCSDEVVSLTGSAEGYDSLQWVTAGDGSFSSPGELQTTYSTGPQDLQEESTDLVLQAFSTSGCEAMDADTTTVTFAVALTAEAGTNDTLCSGQIDYTCSPVIENATAVEWSTTGTGFFNDAALPDATYFISGQDRQSGQITLHVEAVSNFACNATAGDSLLLTFPEAPPVDAGPDLAVCHTQQVALQGSGEQADSLVWETAGDGFFASPHDPETLYTPGSNDVATGSVMLFLHAFGPPPCHPQSTDTMTLTVEPLFTLQVNASPQTITAGESTLLSATTSGNASVNWNILYDSGSGELSSWSGTPVTYSSALSDTAQPVSIAAFATSTGACNVTLSDTVLITVLAPSAIFAGDDIFTCSTASFVSLEGSYDGDEGVIWTTDGDGTFDDATSLVTTYYSGVQDVAEGAVTLTLSSQTSGIIDDNLLVTISQPPAIAVPGVTSGCDDDTVMLTASGDYFSSVAWHSQGDGTFTDPGALTTGYLPGINDANTGEVVLWIEAQPAEGCNQTASDTTTLQLAVPPQVAAGNDTTVCAGQEVVLTSASASGYDDLTWTSSGSGIFSDSHSLHTTYVPSEQDYEEETITLTLSATSEGICETTAGDHQNITFAPAPAASINSGSNSCYGAAVALSAEAQHFSSIAWSSAGSGFFPDSTGITAIYEPSEGDLEAGAAPIMAIAAGTAACSSFPDTASAVIPVIAEPVVNAGENISSCGDDQIYLTGEASGYNSGSILWTTSGDGSFQNDNMLNTYYSPGDQDVENGVVLLTLQASSPDPCNDTFTDDVIVDIQTAPNTPDAPYGDELVCVGEPEVVLQTNPVENADAYIWLLLTTNAGDFEESVTIEPMNVLILDDEFHGNYKVRVKAMNSCGTSDYSEYFSGSVKENPEVDILASPSTEVCQEETILLDATTDEGESYHWWPGDHPATPVTDVDSSGHNDGHKTMYATVTDIFGCSATDSISLFFAVCTHNTAPEDVSFTISPNPAKENVSIQYHRPARVLLLNATGKIIKKIHYPFQERTPLTINVSQFRPGLYYIRLESGSYANVKKIIIIP